VSHREAPTQLAPTPSGYRVPLLTSTIAAPRAHVLFLPALGIPARFYAPLARAMAEQGFAVTRMEQRGHGHSTLRPSRRVDFGFREWLLDDIPAAVEAIRAEHEGPLIVAGHSLGGHLGAVWSALNRGHVDGLALIATASPWPGHFGARTARQIKILRTILPVVHGTFGYYPGERFGFGGREARTLMHDWRHMALRDEYRARGLDLDLETPLRSFDRPLLQIGLLDDEYAPPAGAASMAAKLAAAPRTHVILDAAALGARADHFRWARRPQAVAGAFADWWAGHREG
jgi:predicted alpha/beta hydrolase